MLERDEVDVVGRIDGLSCAENIVSNRNATTEYGGIFYVVDTDGIAMLATYSSREIL